MAYLDRYDTADEIWDRAYDGLERRYGGTMCTIDAEEELTVLERDGLGEWVFPWQCDFCSGDGFAYAHYRDSHINSGTSAANLPRSSNTTQVVEIQTRRYSSKTLRSFGTVLRPSKFVDEQDVEHSIFCVPLNERTQALYKSSKPRVW